MYRLKDNLSCKPITRGIVAVGIAVIVSQATARSATDQRVAITTTASDRSMGSPKAPILMVEYASLTCPPCARFDLDLLPLLKAKYVDPGKVYYVFRVLPLNQVDLAAEAMARCLPATRYLHFIDILYRNQKEWDPEFGATDIHRALVAMGGMVGMTAAQADQCIENNAEVQRATKVGEEAQKYYHITGTPTFIINGRLHVGEFQWPDLQKLLDSLAKKK